MALWYIDALDARAGMALATYRETDLNENSVDLGKPAVFIGPPFFQGESVASRAIGFAATRGSFQLGVFLDGEEIGFETLQGVSEFIRRVYVSSGGGDTDSGISPAPVVPNPEGGGAEFRRLPPEEVAIAREMLNFVSSIAEDIASISQRSHASSRKKQVNRRESTYNVTLQDTLKSFSDLDELLSYGMAVLIEEMIGRLPFGQNEVGAWMRTMMTLGQMLSRLGLYDALAHTPDFDRLLRRATDLEDRHRLFNGYVNEFDAALPVMLGLGPYTPWHPRFGPMYLVGWHPAPGNFDPLDALSSFPLPSIAAKHVGLNPDTANVRDLLSVFLANPTVLEGESGSQPPESTMLAAFVLLASMLIVSSGQASLGPIDATRMSRVLRQDLLKSAVAWMDAQMPSYVFHSDVEKYIRGASQVRYGTRPKEAEGVAYTTA